MQLCHESFARCGEVYKFSKDTCYFVVMKNYSPKNIGKLCGDKTQKLLPMMFSDEHKSLYITCKHSKNLA